ncbi:MAG: MBL fold metallo-hydrolase [Akkermansiaceae bacterium]|nr:MBL fold metallo-hydrolase [Armatimonadota bacterium]
MITEWYLLDTGFCAVKERIAYGTGNGIAPCHAVCGLLHHDARGWLLFDTGYAPRVMEATRFLPYRLYRSVTPFHLREIDTAMRQIARYGLTPDNIETVIVSHFHADHIGGLLDCGAAHFVASRTAFEAIQGRTGLDALRRAFLPPLLPADFAARTTWSEDLHSGEILPGLGATRDLFGDGSCLLVDLPGHARGQIGLIARTVKSESLFFAADATYSARAIRENIPFHPATRFFTDDSRAARATLQALRKYHHACPETLLLPTHCPEVFARCSR